MSNVNNPHGFRPLMRTIDGGFPSTREFKKVVGLGTAVFEWDVVGRVADGSIDVAGNLTPGTTNWSGVALNYGAASTATNHIVIESPGAVFEAQDDDTVTGLVEADMGLNANLVATAGDATLKRSKHQINHTGVDVTNSLDLHLLSKYDVPDNAYGPNCRIEVIFNKHRMNGLTVGV